ncbi:MAG: nucleotide exchange factor GrpE [Alphaproteobacteria bacterium]|nr:nucleotide exchange factor GrpE [Alphaproteobacteria bacterium]
MFDTTVCEVNMDKKKETKTKTKSETQTPATQDADLVKHLQDEVAHWKDLALRNAAEVENIRKRCALDMQNTARYANKDFAKDILATMDNLESAIKHAKVEMGKSDKPCEPFFIGLLQGVELTHKQLEESLGKHAVRKMQDMNTVFNPDKHQVIQQVEDPSKTPGTIVEELQTGYMIGDRVLREAMVIVSK